MCYNIIKEEQRAFQEGREREMSKAFAEKIIDGMVDESGSCGERGLSEKQFDILSSHLEPDEWEPAGKWEGTFTTKFFEMRDWEGNIGRYHVVLNELHHFHERYTVVSIEPRPDKEVRREQELEEMAKFERSEWVSEPKKRSEMTLTLVRDYVYDGISYSYYDSGTRHIYTFADAEGNCIVWKTANAISAYDEDADEWVDAEIGDKVTMKATVKEHNEYKGIKQTVVTRPKVLAIRKGE